jgi:hypothetical protein
MSASLVDPGHIDVMLSIAIHGPDHVCPSRYTAPYVLEIATDNRQIGPVTAETANLVGRALARENVKSVSHHYAEDFARLLSVVPDPDPEGYEWTDLGSFLTVADALCAIDGYEYQSCEHPGWWDSPASHFCHRYRKALIRCIGGYAEAEWLWTTEMALARARRPHIGGRHR